MDEKFIQEIDELKSENKKLKAKLRVARDSQLRTYDGLSEKADKYDELEARFERIQKKVDAQAEDEGIWFMAESGPEAYLQRELRELHRVIERPMLKLTEKESE